MKIDIEHGFANKVYRAFAAFLPHRSVRHEPFALKRGVSSASVSAEFTRSE